MRQKRPDDKYSEHDSDDEVNRTENIRIANLSLVRRFYQQFLEFPAFDRPLIFERPLGLEAFQGHLAEEHDKVHRKTLGTQVRMEEVEEEDKAGA